MMLVVMILNFEVKKLNGRSPSSAKTSRKAVFTTEITVVPIVLYAYSKLYGQICHWYCCLCPSGGVCQFWLKKIVTVCLTSS